MREDRENARHHLNVYRPMSGAQETYSYVYKCTNAIISLLLLLLLLSARRDRTERVRNNNIYYIHFVCNLLLYVPFENRYIAKIPRCISGMLIYYIINIITIQPDILCVRLL